MAMTSSTISSEQFAARELVRDWAAGSGATAAVRDIEQGEPKAWRPVFEGLAGLGLFGVAVPEECGGAGGSVEDLCRDGRRGRQGAGARPGGDHGVSHTRNVRSDNAQGSRLGGTHRRRCARLRCGIRRIGVSGVGHRAVGAGRQFDETVSQASGTVPSYRRRRRRTIRLPTT